MHLLQLGAKCRLKISNNNLNSIIGLIGVFVFSLGMHHFTIICLKMRRFSLISVLHVDPGNVTHFHYEYDVN